MPPTDSFFNPKTLVFAGPVFLGAFLLFQIQPLISKYILPWFGSSASVWTAAMIFFQTALFLGYAYAHASVRYLRPRFQIILHSSLILAALLLLPIIPSPDWKPASGDGDPTLRIFLLLIVSAGLPYFILSSTSPLLQHWFNKTGAGAYPYRLYSLSNAASLLALTSYPLFFEPLMTLKTQAVFWSAGFAVFAAAKLAVMAKVWKSPLNPAAEALPRETPAGTGPLSWKTKLFWLWTATTASLLMLAVTNDVTQDFAPIPFLWILFLGIYLISFIVVFQNSEWYSEKRRGYITSFIILLLFLTLGLHFGIPIGYLIFFFSFLLFTASMICHGELALSKPEPRRLTSFYLFISAGGALGGLFSGLIAPLIFKGYFEIYIGIFLVIAIIAVLFYRDYGWGAIYFQRRPARMIILTTSLIFSALLIAFDLKSYFDVPLFTTRNFYGALSILEYDRDDPSLRSYILLNGITQHGSQFLDSEKRRLPVSYFAKDSGIGLVMTALEKRQDLKIGVIGLGAGTIAAYGKKDDSVIFYEINPQVKEIAEKYFTYLADSAAKVEVAMGDARLSLENEEPRNFDVFIIDAFNSDAIPFHLLTKEAMEVYWRHLKPDGVIAFHISNRYFDFEKPILRLADYFGLETTVIYKKTRSAESLPSNWIIASKNKELLNADSIKKAAQTKTENTAKISLWTDDYVNFLQAF